MDFAKTGKEEGESLKKRICSVGVVLLFGVMMWMVAMRQGGNHQSWNIGCEGKKLNFENPDLLIQTREFSVQNLRVEFVENPIGIDIANPSFSWEMDSEGENIEQYAYRIQVSRQESQNEPDKGQIVWDSGFIQSSDTTQICYQGEPLLSHENYSYTVTCLNEQLHYSVSDEACFQTAYVNEQPFRQAKMICMQGEENVYDEGQAIFIKDFVVDEKALKQATIYATALGIYDAYINGERVGKDELKPGWSNYDESLYYNTYDITEMLMANHNSANDINEKANPENGKSSGNNNRIAVMLGTGWWCGRVGFGTYDYHKPAFVATIRLEYEDGSVEEIHTDESWKYIKDTAVVSADIFNGEVYDGNKITTREVSDIQKETDRISNKMEMQQEETRFGQELKEVDISGDFSGSYHSFYGYQVQNVEKYDKKPVLAVVYNTVVDNGTTYGAIGYQDEETGEQQKLEEVAAGKEIFIPDGSDWEIFLKKGETLILDMGQNMTGVPQVKYSAKQGTKITLDFAEMRNDSGRKKRGNDGPKGSLYTANYRSAVSELTLIAGEEEIEEYQPVFTYYGFRYISVTASDDIILRNLTGKFIGNSSPETGYIKTDHELVNKLYENAAWTQRNNFLLAATDCPQRDERIGWTGDLQVFAKTSLYNQELSSFYKKWFQDVVDSQTEEGAYTDTVPATITTGAGNAGWADAGISIPYDYYKMYGDSKQLLTSYSSMQKYMDYLEKSSNFDRNSGRVGPLTSFGDWLGMEDSDKELISTLYYAKDAMQMEEIAKVLGKERDAGRYRRLYGKIKDYFRDKYMSQGEIKEEYRTQTALVLAMAYDMFTEDEKECALMQLEEKVEQAGGTLSTGFLGTPVILKELSENGRLAEAYQLLLQEKNPSWIYSILQGATTIWERYDSYTIENGFADVAMNSFNHFNNGSVVQWMYENMLGIQMVHQKEYSVLLRPGILLDNEKAPIHKVEGSYQSVYGNIQASFAITAKDVVYQVNIPANCQAKLELPIYDMTLDSTKSNEEKTLTYKEWSLGSGRYTFVYDRQENAWSMEVGK